MVLFRRENLCGLFLNLKVGDKDLLLGKFRHLAHTRGRYTGEFVSGRVVLTELLHNYGFGGDGYGTGKNIANLAF